MRLRLPLSASCLAIAAVLTATGVASAASWQIQATANPRGVTATTLSGVSCVSGRDCIAVGNSQNGAGVTSDLFGRWNGFGWSFQRAPVPSGATSSNFNGVSCSSGTSCIAIGSYSTAGGTFTLAERFNGFNWSIQTTPNPSGATQSVLNSVSCTSAVGCTAVGTSG